MTRTPVLHAAIRAVVPDDSSTSPFSSIFELSSKAEALRACDTPMSAAFERHLDITQGLAGCIGTAGLSAKFGVDEDNQQLVVCVTEKLSGAQVWYNEARTRKPQTFKASGTGLADPTEDGQNCDFCRWQELTASDTFGRVQNKNCVTASNLFKFAYPCHGLALFRHHHPLEFTAPQVSDLLAAAAEWFDRSHAKHPCASWPLFLWNCLPRAGASQFHGHAQMTLTEVPVPAAKMLYEVQQKFKVSNPQLDYLEDLMLAHKAPGLARTLRVGNAQASCYASLAPTKAAEFVVHGAGLRCPAFASLLHACLRTLIDRLGVTSFNVGIHIPPFEGSLQNVVVARVVSRGQLSSRASDFGGLEVFGHASIGHTDPCQLILELDQTLRDL